MQIITIYFCSFGLSCLAEILFYFYLEHLKHLQLCCIIINMYHLKTCNVHNIHIQLQKRENLDTNIKPSCHQGNISNASLGERCSLSEWLYQHVNSNYFSFWMTIIWEEGSRGPTSLRWSRKVSHQKQDINLKTLAAK